MCYSMHNTYLSKDLLRDEVDPAVLRPEVDLALQPRGLAHDDAAGGGRGRGGGGGRGAHARGPRPLAVVGRARHRAEAEAEANAGGGREGDGDEEGLRHPLSLSSGEVWQSRVGGG